MAEGRVEQSGIIQTDIFKDTRDSALATMAVVNELKASLSSIASSTKNGLRENGLQTKEDIEKLAVALQKIKELTEANNKLKSVEAEANKLLSKSYNDLTESEKEELILLAEKKIIRAETTKLIKQETIVIKDVTDSYKKLNNEYDIAQRKAKNLGVQFGVNSKEFKAAAASSNELRDKIFAIDQSLGQFHKNVGNYASGYNGLATAISRLTQEAPSAAVSMNTFFLAISNNIPMLADEIAKINRQNKELAANGEKTVSVAKSLASAFFSWQTLLSVGVTLLTLYGGKLIDYITGTKDATEAAKKWNEELEKNNQTVRNLNIRLQETKIKYLESWGMISSDAATKARSELRRRVEILQKEEEFKKKLNELNKEFIKENGTTVTISAYNKHLDAIKAITDERQRQLDIINKIYDLEFNTNTAKAETSGKQSKAVKAKKEEVKEFKNIDDELTQSRIDLIENEQNRKEAQIIFEYQKQVRANNEIYKAGKELDELNMNEAEKANKEIIALREDYRKRELEAALKLRDAESKADKQRADERKKQLEDIKKMELALLDLLAKANENYYNRKVKLIDYDLQKSQSHQQELALLAQKGVENASDNYAFEQKKQAELEEQRLKLERQKERTALAIGVYRAYAANGGDLKKTLTDATALAALAGTLPVYYKGTENTGEGGNLDDKGGFTAILHPNERVLTKDQNARIGDISNDELANVAQRARLMSPSYAHTITDVEFKKIGNKLDKVVDAIEKIEIPREKYNWNAKQKALIHVVETRNKITKTHHKVGGIW